METSKNPVIKNKTKRKWVVGGIVAAMALLIGISMLLAAGGGSHDLLADFPKAVVTRGELVVSIVETGEIQAQKKTIIANNLRWSAVIVYRVDEGTHVKVGDLIIKLECQELFEATDRTALEVTAAENDYQRALEQIELTRKEWINRVAQAEAGLENLQNDIQKFSQHERKQSLQEAERGLALASQDLELAEGKLQFMESVNRTAGLEGTYSLSTVKAENLRVERLRLTVSNAEAEVEKLEIYELPQQERALQLSLADAELALERAVLEAKAQRRLADVNKAAKESALEMQKRKLEDLHAQREMVETRAEAPGVIVYDSGNHWDAPDLSVGALVQSRRRLMRIPDMSTLRVYSKVFEGVSEKVQLGMPVTIHLDSREEILTGRVAQIAQLASTEDRRYNPNVKVFPIEIEMDVVPEGLKPGSSAQIELILNRLPDAQMVKIAAVFTEQERTYVWRVADGLAHRTEVTIGEMSDTHVQILSGLADGDTVLMAPPPDAVAVTPASWTDYIPPTVDEALPMEPPETELIQQAPAPEPTADAANPDEQPRGQRPRGEGGQRPARGGRAGGGGTR